MVQLLELSCAVCSGAVPGVHQLFQMGACPLWVLCPACQACICFGYISETEEDAVFRQLNSTHHLIWDIPPKCMFVIQWKPSSVLNGWFSLGFSLMLVCSLTCVRVNRDMRQADWKLGSITYSWLTSLCTGPCMNRTSTSPSEMVLNAESFLSRFAF